MKKVFSLFLASLLVSSAAVAQTETSFAPYAALRVGASQNTAKFKIASFKEDGSDTSFNGRIAFGAAINKKFRAEVEASLLSKMEDSFGGYTFGGNPGEFKVELKAQHYLLNGYYDFDGIDQSKKLRPFIGAGIGFARFERSFWFVRTNGLIPYSEKKDDTVLALMGTLGFSYDVTEKFIFDVSARYTYADYEEGYNSFAVDAGIRFMF